MKLKDAKESEDEYIRKNRQENLESAKQCEVSKQNQLADKCKTKQEDNQTLNQCSMNLQKEVQQLTEKPHG